MDSTERVRRFNLLREGLEDVNNKIILDSAVSSLYCRLSTVTQEVFFHVFSTIKDKEYINNRRNNNEYDDEENEDYDENYDVDRIILMREEYNLIVNKLFDMIKEELEVDIR